MRRRGSCVIFFESRFRRRMALDVRDYGRLGIGFESAWVVAGFFRPWGLFAARRSHASARVPAGCSCPFDRIEARRSGALARVACAVLLSFPSFGSAGRIASRTRRRWRRRGSRLIILCVQAGDAIARRSLTKWLNSSLSAHS